MSKVTYYGIVHKDEGSDYGVSFPDFPGCVAADAVLENALLQAQEALVFHIEGMIEDSEAIPEPRRIDELSHEDTPLAVVMVRVEVPALRVKRFSITAPAQDIQHIDNFLKSLGRSRDRSEFLVRSSLEIIKNLVQADFSVQEHLLSEILGSQVKLSDKNLMPKVSEGGTPEKNGEKPTRASQQRFLFDTFGTERESRTGQFVPVERAKTHSGRYAAGHTLKTGHSERTNVVGRDARSGKYIDRKKASPKVSGTLKEGPGNGEKGRKR